MPWFKVDDTLTFHAKVVAAGNAAMGVWVRAGAWSSQQLTEGHIPAHIAATIGTRGEIKRLVTVGLWTEAPGGYQFWQWDKDGRQPTKEQVESNRAAARERQRLARERAKSRRDGDVTSGVTDGEVTVPPTRPDPTRPVPSTSEEQLRGDRHLTTADEIASTRPACTKHPNGDSGEACRSCARVNDWNERADKRAAEERARRARECRTCEGMGFHLDADTRQPTKRRCEHRETA